MLTMFHLLDKLRGNLQQFETQNREIIAMTSHACHVVNYHKGKTALLFVIIIDLRGSFYY